MAMLKYTLYVWTEEAFRQWKQGPYGRGDEGDNDPASYEMYDVSEDEVKKQLADHFGCSPDDVFPSTVNSKGGIDPDDGESFENAGLGERAFGMIFWDVAYPDGIGSYLIALNSLDWLGEEL